MNKPELFIKPAPFIDNDKEYIELDPIDIFDIYVVSNGFISLHIIKDYIIDIRNMEEIQKEIENLWNYTDVLFNYRSN